MNIVKLKKQMMYHEGKRNKLYKCSAGKLTIGIGHNIEDNGVSDAVIDLMFQEDIYDVLEDLTGMFSEFNELPENIQLVLADMRFQLGGPRFRGFRNMISAAKTRDWSAMVREMKDSVWYRQVPNRANNLIAMVEEV